MAQVNFRNGISFRNEKASQDLNKKSNSYSHKHANSSKNNVSSHKGHS